MLFVLVGFLVLLLAVCVARIALLPWSWLTFSLVSIALGFVFYFPSVDHAMDGALRRSVGLANLSDLLHILLTLAAWWALGVMALRALRRESRLDAWWRDVLAEHDRTRRLVHAIHGHRPRAIASLWLWTAANAVTAAVVLVIYAASDLPHTEVDDMLDLGDIGTRLLTAMYGGWAFVGGVLVVTAAATGLRTTAERDLRPALWVMVCVGTCGIGYATTAATIAAMDGVGALQRHALGVMSVWAIPGLALLAASGSAAFLARGWWRPAHR
ncbi:hypothetical protein [Nocardia concava]|uniref:hypothetical protein n=1 Tax=Nocardia concava TaxID=257281 RepID=UPI000313F27D|nr:hypothetical protein [Nocardia concava]